MQSLLSSGNHVKITKFPNAPEGWSIKEATEIAIKQGILLSKDHLIALRAIQEYSATHEGRDANVREIHDALNEKFHPQGGIRYLYELFPGGPVAQGYLIAGLQPPAGAINKSFGSVQ